MNISVTFNYIFNIWCLKFEIRDASSMTMLLQQSSNMNKKKLKIKIEIKTFSINLLL